LINIVCDRALIGAYIQGQDRVDGPTLDKAAREVFGSRDNGLRRNKLLRLAIAGLVIMVCGTIAAVLFYGNAWHTASETAGAASNQQRFDTLWWFNDNSSLWKPPNFTEDPVLAAKKNKIARVRSLPHRLNAKHFDVALPSAGTLPAAGNIEINKGAEGSDAIEATQLKQINPVGNALRAVEFPNGAKPEEK
jgi:hypothetical protein